MEYDIAVIGGGPAGMMAAGRAGELGARVVLIEKNKSLGVKLLITGNGRCNITNNKDKPKAFIDRFGKNGKFLFSPFLKFRAKEVINFFENRDVKTKTEEDGRVFPLSDKSQDVLGSLIDYLKASNVEIKKNSAVKEILKKNNRIEKIVLSNNEEIFADKFVICTGGKSYPATGSTGDGYKWAEKLGHKVTELFPSLSPVIVRENIVRELEGLILKNVEISIYKDNKKIDSRFGEAIFTADGISGPIIMDMSKRIGKEIPGNVKLRIDFCPSLNFLTLDKKIQGYFQRFPNKMVKNSFDELLPQRLLPVIAMLSEINPETKASSVTKKERRKLLHSLKAFDLEVERLVGYSKAIITAGGINLKEIDSKTMKSKLIDNLYFAGEIIDLDATTGGYNLQMCWSTGYAAGDFAGRN